MNGSPERSEGKKVFEEEAPPGRAGLFTFPALSKGVQFV